MKQKLRHLVTNVRAKFSAASLKTGAVVGLLVTGGNAFAQSTGSSGVSIDTSGMTANIAAGLAAALLVSAAYTAAVIGIRSSKMPRRGA